jgi:hypothetical protein
MAPREVPIVLGIFVAMAALVAFAVAAQLDRAEPRPEGARVVQLDPRPRHASTADGLAIGGVALAGLITAATAVRAQRRRSAARGTDAGAPAEPGPGGRMFTRRAALAMSLWTCFTAPALWYMLRRPPAELPLFVGPCVLLLPPIRVYLRYRDGEAEWVPWILGCAAITLAITADPRSAWALASLALVCHACALAQERRRRQAG